MTHYEVGKHLSNLLQPLTINEFTMKDSFDTASKIRDIPKELFTNGYVFVSFDVTFQRKTMKKNVLVRSRTFWIALERSYDIHVFVCKQGGEFRSFLIVWNVP